MKDADWFYHLTRKQVALIIKQGGMTSAVHRIGRAVPHPFGAFVQNRKKKEASEYQQKLKGYLIDLMARGCSEGTLRRTRGVYVPFTLVLRGSNEDDVPRVDQLEAQYLNQYKRLLPNLGQFDRPTFNKLKKDVLVDELVNDLLVRDKNHFLARLAVQYVTYRNNIEEMITASHVYFLRPGCAVDGYNDYKKHLDSNQIVVLRVHKDNLPGLVDDDSDYRAVMTERIVPANVIEVMQNHDNFTNEDYRSNAQNWQPLANLQ
ncbi:MAG TPA: hypothetical protein VFZ66_22080 [Herpetosiphonaceae bacterium]